LARAPKGQCRHLRKGDRALERLVLAVEDEDSHRLFAHVEGYAGPRRETQRARGLGTAAFPVRRPLRLPR
jgi:hypothetical protein